MVGKTKFFMWKIMFLTLFVINIDALGQKGYFGVVKDSETKESLPGATIFFEKNKKTQIADNQGRFSFQADDLDSPISVSIIGYLTKKIVTDIKPASNTFEILLDKDTKYLNEVVVSTGTPIQDFNRPILGVNSLSVKTINKLPTPLGETDILKGLQMLPGVSSVGEASNGLNVRGGTTDQNLILLDNAPIFNPTHMFGLFSAFPSDGISNLQLYKGNIPSRFGGRSASVLDISLRNPSLTKFKMDGGISMVSEKVSMEIPLIKEKLAIMISGRGSFNDFILPVVSPKFKEMKSNFGDIASRLFYKLNSKNTITLSNYLSYDFFQTELLGTIKNVNASSTQYKYYTKNISGKWNMALSKSAFLETIYVNSEYKPDILLPEIGSDNKVVVKQGIKYNQIKSSYKIQSNNHFLEAGLDGIKYDINPGNLEPNQSVTVSPISTQKEFGFESGLFFSDDFNFRKKLDISAGLRISRFDNLGPSSIRYYKPGEERTESNLVSIETLSKNKTIKHYQGIEPRLGLKYAINSKVNAKLGYNLSRQYLQQVSNTTTPLPTSRWKLSDHNIRPQVSQLISGGVNVDLNNKTYVLGAEIYFRKTKDIIDYVPGADFFLKDFPETELLQGENKSYGLELMASKEKGMATGWINYTYSRSLNRVNEGSSERQRINDGVYYPANYDRPHSFNSSLIIGQGKHHDFAFNFTFSTGRPFTSPQGLVEFNNNLFPYYSERNNQRIPAYHRLDFAWNIYNPKMNPNRRFKGNWAFSVYNLYGQKNAYSVFYRSENRVLNPYKLIIFGSPIPSLAYKFNFE
ncbi:MAG: TonB-dependent receptor [Spirosomataceae bacterium]